MSFTVTAGSGRYAGGTGSGTLTAQFGGLGARTGGVGHMTWTGALTVPGLEFDVTPPAPSGAVGKSVVVKKTARRARVRFSVAAREAVDGPVPTTCKPRSGSWFPVGKTRVRCAGEAGRRRVAARVGRLVDHS